MTPDDIKDIVFASLKRIAPEIATADLRPDVNLRDELDLDSMDFLNFVMALHERLGIDIPESDYPKLYTLGGAVAYLSAAVATRAATPRR